MIVVVGNRCKARPQQLGVLAGGGSAQRHVEYCMHMRPRSPPGSIGKPSGKYVRQRLVIDVHWGQMSAREVRERDVARAGIRK